VQNGSTHLQTEPSFQGGLLPHWRRIRYVTTRLESLAQPSDYYPFLLFHVGTNDVATKCLRLIKRDFRILGRKLKNSGAQAVFSSVLPVMGRDFRRNKMSPGYQELPPVLVPPSKLWGFKLWKIQGMLGPNGIHLMGKMHL